MELLQYVRTTACAVYIFRTTPRSNFKYDCTFYVQYCTFTPLPLHYFRPRRRERHLQGPSGCLRTGKSSHSTDNSHLHDTMGALAETLPGSAATLKNYLPVQASISETMLKAPFLLLFFSTKNKANLKKRTTANEWIDRSLRDST